MYKFTFTCISAAISSFRLHALPCYQSCTQQAVCCGQNQHCLYRNPATSTNEGEAERRAIHVDQTHPPPQKKKNNNPTLTMQNLNTKPQATLGTNFKQTEEGSACGLNEWKNSLAILRHCWIDKSRYKFWFRRWETGGWLRQTGVCLTHFTLSREHINIISKQRNDFTGQALKRSFLKTK